MRGVAECNLLAKTPIFELSAKPGTSILGTSGKNVLQLRATYGHLVRLARLYGFATPPFKSKQLASRMLMRISGAGHYRHLARS